MKATLFSTRRSVQILFSGIVVFIGIKFYCYRCADLFDYHYSEFLVPVPVSIRRVAGNHRIFQPGKSSSTAIPLH